MDLRRIKKLNEEMRNLLHEISPELKQKVRDTRKANYLAARTSLDKAKAKYQRNIKLNNSKKTVTKNLIINGFNDISDEIMLDLDRDMSIDTVDGQIFTQDGNVFKMTITATSLFRYSSGLYTNSEQALKDLLAEMSKKYGINYKYKVLDGYKIEIYTEPLNIDNRSVMEQILAGTYYFGDDYDEFPDTIVANLDSLTDEQLLFIFNTYGDGTICPSNWDFNKYGYYPAKLAYALSRSNISENFSEYYNVFYRRHKLSDEACDVFAQAFAKEGVDEYIDLAYDTGGANDQTLAYIGCLSESYPDICKKLLTQLVAKRPKAKEEFLEILNSPYDYDDKFLYMMDTNFVADVLEAL